MFKLKNILILLCVFVVTFFSLNFTNTSLYINHIEKVDITKDFFKARSNSKFAYIDKDTLNIKLAKEKSDIDLIKSKPHTFHAELELNKDEEIFISFVVKNNDSKNVEDSKNKHLYVDLYGKDFDSDENQFIVEIPSKIEEFREKLYVGKNHPKKVKLRFFSYDNINITISNISVWKYSMRNRMTQNLIFSLLLAVISFLLFKFTKSKGQKVLCMTFIITIIISLSIFLRYLNHTKSVIICDEATYIAQSHSLAFDFDNMYQEKDFVRFLLSINKSQGPQGLFLNYYDNKYYFSKTILFPLFGAPFSYFFGIQGLEVLNFFCFFGLIALAYIFLQKRNDKILSCIFAISFIGLSVALDYIFESFIDLFNIFFLGASVLLFLRYTENPKDNKSYLYICAVLFGILISSRVPYFFFAFFCGLKLLLDKKYGFRAALIFAFFFLIPFLGIAIFHIIQIGHFSPYGGVRFHYDRLVPFMNVYDGKYYTSAQLLEMKFRILTGAFSILDKSIYAISDIRAFLYNFMYFLIGRQTGCLIYFPCIFLVLFNIRLKSIRDNWFILFGIICHILFFMLQCYDNFFGGGQSLGNRYFLQILLMFLFLTPTISIKRTLIGACFAFFIYLHFLIAPIHTSLWKVPDFRNRDVMLKLPFDYTQYRQIIDIEKNGVIYIIRKSKNNKVLSKALIWRGPLDSHYPIENKETNKYWTKGSKKQIFIIASNVKLKEISFNVGTGFIDNKIRTSDGQVIKLYKSDSTRRVSVKLKLKHKFYDTYYYEFLLKPKYSFVPKEISSSTNSDTRVLGVSLQNFALVYK